MYPLAPEDERDLVDQIALVFEHAGQPPVMSQLLAYLMVCDPPEQSSGQLADYLGASKGAISQGTRSLMQAGLIERVRVRGERSSFFRVAEGAWHRAMDAEVARVAKLRRVAEAGLSMMQGAPEARTARLREFRDMNAFFEAEFPALLARWEQKRERRDR